MRSNKRDSYFGMNKYMPSYFVQANYDGIGVKKEDGEHIMFDVFEYEDIKNIENEVKSFVKRHMNWLSTPRQGEYKDTLSYP